MEVFDLVVIGGGAAGFFGAIAAAEARPGLRVLIVERASQPLAKVRISGGGRCNVTHACFEPRPLAGRYPRGSRALLAAFARFQPADTVSWFEQRGVRLKTESDGRMFPTTDHSETIVECLVRSASRAGVVVQTRCGVESLKRGEDGEWLITFNQSSPVRARRVLVASGGCRSGNFPAILTALGHTLEKPVPSLFTFHIESPWVRALAGLALESEVSIPGQRLRERGPVLFTHWGLSGPAILRLSAWGARDLEAVDYAFPLQVSWLPDATQTTVQNEFLRLRTNHPGKAVLNLAPDGIPARLWEALCHESGVGDSVRWNQLPRSAAEELFRRLLRTELAVSGKSLHKDEFVTCGGVRLPEVDLRTMESRVVPGLYFAGEVLDIDGITGGFNFQAAWTTGWIAGRAISQGV
jgi:predicted Rossmann fold flavoprotein